EARRRTWQRPGFLPRSDPDCRPSPTTSFRKSPSHVRFLDGYAAQCDNQQAPEVALRTALLLSDHLRAQPSWHRLAMIAARFSIRSCPELRVLPKKEKFLQKHVPLVVSEASLGPTPQSGSE